MKILISESNCPKFQRWYDSDYVWRSDVERQTSELHFLLWFLFLHTEPPFCLLFLPVNL